MIGTRRELIANGLAALACERSDHQAGDTMKFVQFTTPNGLPVYIAETMMVIAATDARRSMGSLIRSQAGQEQVRETPAEVVAMLEAAL